MRLFSLLFIVPLCGLLVCADAQAEDTLTKVQLPLKTPRARDSVLGGPKESAEFAVWLPDGVKTVRGAICNPFSKMDKVSGHWQAACRHWQFAYVSADFDAIKKDEYPLLAAGMTELAKKTKHPELEQIPFCFIGMSRGGGMSMQFSELYPERTIACAPVCLEVGPNTEAGRQIPVLTIFGDKDGMQLTKLLDKLPIQRAEKARWAIAAQWGRGHEFGQANNLALIHFDDAIKTRLPATEDAAKSAALKPYPLESGWLAGPIAWTKNQPPAMPPTAAAYAKYEGEKNAAVWLTSARTAAVWQAFVAPSKQVKITAPAGLGDGQAFATLPADKPLAVTAEITGDKPSSVELWDADVRIDTKTAEPWEFSVSALKPGIHSLIIKAHHGESNRLSRPHTIIVVGE